MKAMLSRAGLIRASGIFTCGGKMFVRLLFVMVILLMSGSFAKGQERAPEPPPSNIWGGAMVDYCELLRDEMMYDGRWVKVRAIYSKGAGGSKLSSPFCPAADSTRLEDGNFRHRVCPSRKMLRRVLRVKPGRSVDVVVNGIFEAGKGENSPRILMNCVLDVKPSGQFRGLPQLRR
jgi:hypothetical protein